MDRAAHWDDGHAMPPGFGCDLGQTSLGILKRSLLKKRKPFHCLTLNFTTCTALLSVLTVSQAVKRPPNSDG